MSASGIRVVCDAKPSHKIGYKLNLHLQTQNEKLAVTAQIEWIRKDDRGRYQIGAEFVEITPQQAFELINLARASISPRSDEG